MKFIVMFFLCLFIFNSNVHAQAFTWGGENIALIVDLPNTSDYAIDGKYVDIGIIFKSFGIEGFSLWNYNKRWCVFNGKTYWEMEKEQLDEIANELGIVLPAKMDLPFGNEWGGRLTLLGIFGGVVIIILIWDKARPKVKILKPLDGSLNNQDAANVIFRGYYKIKKINNTEVKWSAVLAKAASILLTPGNYIFVFDYAEEKVAKGKGFTAQGNLEAGKTYLLKSILNKTDNTMSTDFIQCQGDDLKKYLAFVSDHLNQI
ncbi:MAG: hypothetical protein Ta2B_09700 [Termitinemataceae bacterium]|nr:MAG: hypothetical protein Ta2B_09700 [Termitinemataceae bacterium]